MNFSLTRRILTIGLIGILAFTNLLDVPKINSQEVQEEVRGDFVMPPDGFLSPITILPEPTSEEPEKKEISVEIPQRNVVTLSTHSTECSGMIWPVVGSTHVTQGYSRGHQAFDISYADDMHPEIISSQSGTVIIASYGWNGGYGNTIVIDHGDGYKTRYGHMQGLAVGVGEEVRQGQVLGVMGNTGNVHGITGIHLHWEVLRNGVRINPNSCL